MVQLTPKYRGSSNKPTSLPILFCTPHIEVRKLTSPLKEGSLSDEIYFSVAIVPFETEAVKNTDRAISGWCFIICNIDLYHFKYSNIRHDRFALE